MITLLCDAELALSPRPIYSSYLPDVLVTYCIAVLNHTFQVFYNILHSNVA